MPKLALLRGKPTSGKSTAFQTLREDKRMTNWVFIDHASIKKMFEHINNIETKKSLSKDLLFTAIKEVMPLEKNIIIEEMSEETICKYIGSEVQKYNYKIITFQFEVSINTAYLRNIRRAKDKWHPYIKKKNLEALHKMHEEKFDMKGILVDTNKLNKKQVVELIIRKLK